MAEIYTNQEGLQVYDYSGQTYNAKTGEVLGTAPVQQQATSIYDLGYSQPDVQETQGFEELEPKPLISSQQGETFVSDAQKTQESLTTIGVDTKEAEPKEPQRTKVTLINPITDQTVTFEDALINRTNIENYLSSGYELAEASGSIPSWLRPKTAEGTTVSDTESRLDEARADFEDAKNKLLNFNLSNDPALNSLLQGIATGWDARMNDMRRVNASREAAVQALGFRLGTARYAAGVAGGILTGEEREGLNRLSELEGRKQAALAEARQAYEKNKWDQYVKLVDIAEKEYDNQLKTVENLNKKNLEEQKFLFEKEKFFEQQANQAKRDEQNDISKALVDLAKVPGLPSDILNSATNSKSLNELLNVAGDWMQTGTGIVGEYLYYKRDSLARGQTPVDFNAYQTADANRKKPVVNVNERGLPNYVITQVDRIMYSFDNSQIVKDFNVIQNKKLTFDRIIGSGIQGPGDLALIFEFMKALDPLSVVRESEYETAAKSGNIFLSWAKRFNGYLSEGGGFLPDKVREDFQKLVEMKYDASIQQYDNLRNEKARLIENKTRQYDPGTPGGDYLINYKSAVNTGENLIQSEEQSEQKVLDYVGQHPDVQNQVESLLSEVQEDIGRPYTYSEVLQILGL